MYSVGDIVLVAKKEEGKTEFLYLTVTKKAAVDNHIWVRADGGEEFLWDQEKYGPKAEIYKIERH